MKPDVMLGLPCHSTVEYKQLIENKSVLSKRITYSPYVMVTLSPNCCLKGNPVTVTEGMLGVWITCLKARKRQRSFISENLNNVLNVAKC